MPTLAKKYDLCEFNLVPIGTCVIFLYLIYFANINVVVRIGFLDFSGN